MAFAVLINVKNNRAKEEEKKKKKINTKGWIVRGWCSCTGRSSGATTTITT
jgi:hypothetical protein